MDNNVLKLREGEAYTGLVELCKYLKPKLRSHPIIVEIGSFAGESTEIFFKNLGDCSIYSVDPYIGGYDDNDDVSKENMVEAEKAFYERMKEYIDHFLCHPKKMTSIMCAQEIADNGVDVVYIDGNHQEMSVALDIITWLPKILRTPYNRGFICGHDYNMDTVKRAISNTLGKVDRVFQDQSWVKQI